MEKAHIIPGVFGLRDLVVGLQLYGEGGGTSHGDGH